MEQPHHCLKCAQAEGDATPSKKLVNQSVQSNGEDHNNLNGF